MVKLQYQGKIPLAALRRLLHLFTFSCIIIIISVLSKPTSAGILTGTRINFTPSTKVLSNLKQRPATTLAAAAVNVKPHQRPYARLTEEVETWKRLNPGEELPEKYNRSETSEGKRVNPSEELPSKYKRTETVEEEEEDEEDEEEEVVENADFDEEDDEDEEAHLVQEEAEEEVGEHEEQHEEEEVPMEEPENENEEAIANLEDESNGKSLLQVWFANTLKHAIELFYIDATGEMHSASLDGPAILGPSQSFLIESNHGHTFHAYRIGNELTGQPLKVFYVDIRSRGEDGWLRFDMEL